MTLNKKNILFYYPSNKRSIAMETILIALNSNGEFNVIGLTTCEKGDLHKVLEKNEIKTFSYVISEKPKILYYLKHLFFLIKFCKKNNIDFIHSHLQPVNIITVFAQYFIKTKVIIFRHHFQYLKNSSYSYKKNTMEHLFDSIINKLAKIIVVPSTGVRNGMIEEENVNTNKIKILPYIYNFNQYNKPNNLHVEEIKKRYPAKIRLIMVSRLIKLKQHHIVFPVIKELIIQGRDIQLMVLDEGPEKENLTKWIERNNMTDYIHMLGFKKDFIDYMAASDVLIQPSLTDASNSVAKEMALLEKIIIVSDTVGDYSDYIKDGENGYLLPTNHPQEQLKSIIINIYENINKHYIFGVKLKNDILKLYSMDNSNEILEVYYTLMKN
jgi:glycosyltransferase involved in cell wall biosynthesis